MLSLNIRNKFLLIFIDKWPQRLTIGALSHLTEARMRNVLDRIARCCWYDVRSSDDDNENDFKIDTGSNRMHDGHAQGSRKVRPV